MSEISNLGYLVLGVSNLQAWEPFATELIGLQLSQKQEGEYLGFRMDAYSQRFLLEHSPADDLLAAGWEFPDSAALEAYVAQLRSHGVEVQPLDAEALRRRKVERAYGCDDPNGFRQEFYCGPSIEGPERPFQSSCVSAAGFKTGPLGVGHIVPRSVDYQQSLDWYTRVMGLRISDHIREEIEPGKFGEATFFHTLNGRHHSLATVFAPVPKVLVHFMVEVNDFDDVGRAYDRFCRAGVVPYRALGRHTNDRMLSFYARTPSGFAVEVGYGGVVIDDASWQVTTHGSRSDWGHK